MTQYRRKGQDWSTEFDSPPSPDHWELLVDEPAPKAKASADTSDESKES